jgi:hypothetical protein
MRVCKLPFFLGAAALGGEVWAETTPEAGGAKVEEEDEGAVIPGCKLSKYELIISGGGGLRAGKAATLERPCTETGPATRRVDRGKEGKEGCCTKAAAKQQQEAAAATANSGRRTMDEREFCCVTCGGCVEVRSAVLYVYILIAYKEGRAGGGEQGATGGWKAPVSMRAPLHYRHTQALLNQAVRHQAAVKCHHKQQQTAACRLLASKAVDAFPACSWCVTPASHSTTGKAKAKAQTQNKSMIHI